LRIEKVPTRVKMLGVLALNKREIKYLPHSLMGDHQNIFTGECNQMSK
jgi:hypothetical protein